jgi:hypothetical protein
MLITGLVGLIFLGLSLFPAGTKPLIAWDVWLQAGGIGNQLIHYSPRNV